MQISGKKKNREKSFSDTSAGIVRHLNLTKDLYFFSNKKEINSMFLAQKYD